MKIRKLRELVTGADKPLRMRYEYGMRPGATFIDDGIRFDEGWVVFEEPGKDDDPRRKYYTVGEFVEAVDNGVISGHIDDGLRESLNEISKSSLTISVLISCFPDDFEIEYKNCHLLYFRNDPEDYCSYDIEYYFHNGLKDAYTRRADICIPKNRRSKKKRIHNIKDHRRN